MYLRLHTLNGRALVQGLGQGPGIVCCCRYRPICRIQSIRMGLAIAASEDWEVLLQLDIHTVFRNAEVQKEAYVKPPPGCESLDQRDETQENPIRDLSKKCTDAPISPAVWVIPPLGLLKTVVKTCLQVGANGRRVVHHYYLANSARSFHALYPNHYCTRLPSA